MAISENPADKDQFPAVLAELVQINPEAAARFASSLESAALRAQALRLVAQNWAAQDPASAEKWASHLPDESERDSTLADVCFQIAQTDARQAVEAASQHGLEKMPGAVMENLVQQWAGQDFSSAASWIKQRPPGEQRDQMVERLALVQAVADPAAAAQLVVQEVPPGDIQTEAAIAVLHQWALRDMAGAKAWVELFSAGPLRDRAQNEVSNLEAWRQSAAINQQ